MLVLENASRFLKTEYRHLSLRETLEQSPLALAGVNEAIASKLKLLDIETVFDLATSNVFDNAAAIDMAGEEASNLYRRYGRPGKEVLSVDFSNDVPIEELRYQHIGILKQVGAAHEKELQDSLNVQTIQDLAGFPPYLFAKAILNAVFFPENQQNFDAEAPDDLVPKSGEYPTEKVTYSTLIFDGVGNPDTSKSKDILDSDFDPVDVNSITDGNWGFDKVAFGAMLTFTQSWYMQGVTLGQLLHSTALAPGESTRIAVIDWSRRSRASQTEYISETDDLTNQTAHNRSISEVTSAVAREAQGGFSSSHTESTTSQSASSSASTSQAGSQVAGAISNLVSDGLSAAGSMVDSLIPW